MAAGIVFAAVAGKLIPEIKAGGAPVPVVLDFALGVAVVLGVRWLTERLGGAHGSASEEPSAGADAAGGLPISLLVMVAIDLALDGLLVGVGFAAGAEQDILLTIALTLEVLFLGLATAAALLKGGASRA